MSRSTDRHMPYKAAPGAQRVRVAREVVASARRSRGRVRCRCGLLCVSREELTEHVAESMREHGLEGCHG